MTQTKRWVPGFVPYQEIHIGPRASVYEARRRDGKRVALKVAHDTSNDGVLASARLAHGLDHPNLVPSYDYGRADGTPWCAMEMLDGVPLDAFLMAPSFGLRDRVRVLLELLDALCFLEASRIPTRALIPEHVLWDAHGRVRLLAIGCINEPGAVQPFVVLARTILQGATSAPIVASCLQADGQTLSQLRTALTRLDLIGYDLDLHFEPPIWMSAEATA